MSVQQLLLQFVFQGSDFFDGLVIYDFVEYRRRQVQSQAMITYPTMKPLATTFLLAILPLCVSAQPTLADLLTYEQHVRPILKANCFHCHGEHGSAKAQLDLRLRRFIVRGGQSGAAIVPSQPSHSLLLDRIAAGEMPPGDKKLSKDEITIIRQWIEQGATTQHDEPASLNEETYFTQDELDFWAFQPIDLSPVPVIDSNRPTTSPIDRFIGHRLEQEHLDFSLRASNRTLIRRVTFDLVGIPPSLDEVDRFVADKTPNAFERFVDRLLASPHYGERWGRHWLDVAGYADSEGYVDSDPVRSWAHGYRDFVIRAFNRDMPFNQFVIEQIAGDELVRRPYTDLSEKQIRQLTATGFLRMAPDGTGDAGVDQNAARNEVVADTINIIGTALLGLTLDCARCHDHRYDPISQRDYYELRAIFEPALDWQDWRSPDERRISLYSDQDRTHRDQIEQHAQKAEQHRQQVIDAHVQRTLNEELIKVPNDVKEDLRTAFQQDAEERSSEQIALLKEYPNVQNISSGSLYLYSQQRARRADEIATVANQTEKRFIVQVQESQPAVTVTTETLADFDPASAALIAEYRAAAEKCRNTDAKKEMEDLQQAVNDIRATIPQEPFIRALTEPVNHIPQTTLFLRGNHNQPAQIVSPGELDMLCQKAPVEIPTNDSSLATSGRRLAYARHLTNGDHPLVARVMVNRVWLHHFGHGLVRSPGDFGRLGQRPTHPDLLDWLARDLMESGWQIKRLHRQILLSHTYRQASSRTPELDQLDPDNELYARQFVRRIESESFRDAVLMVSGLMNHKMFGPPVPVKEDGVGQIVLGIQKLDGERKPIAGKDLGGEVHRRSVYVQVRRSRPLAVLETFDIASVSPNCTQRATSNVTPQSLLLMNSHFMLDYAKSFATRVAQEAGDELNSQLGHIWKIAYCEEPSAAAMLSLNEFYHQQVEIFQTDNEDLNQSAARRRALAVVCQAIMAANQFMYID